LLLTLFISKDNYNDGNHLPYTSTYVKKQHKLISLMNYCRHLTLDGLGFRFLLVKVEKDGSSTLKPARRLFAAAK